MLVASYMRSSRYLVRGRGNHVSRKYGFYFYTRLQHLVQYVRTFDVRPIWAFRESRTRPASAPRTARHSDARAGGPRDKHVGCISRARSGAAPSAGAPPNMHGAQQVPFGSSAACSWCVGRKDVQWGRRGGDGGMPGAPEAPPSRP